LLLGAAALLVAAGSFHLWRRAERAGEIALSRQLAAQSATALAEAAPDTALRLAAAAGQHASSFEAQDSLLAALAQAPLDWRSAGQQGLFSLAVRADGGLIASGGRDGSIRLWRGGADLTPAARLDAHKEQVLALAFSPDGQRLASAGIDRRVILWDVRDPARPQRLAERADHEGPVLAVAFSPDGQRLASAGSDRRIVLRDGHSGQPVGPVLDAHGDTVTGLAFSPDGRLLASTGYDGALLLWATDGTATPRLSASHPAVLYGVAFSPDGNLIATAGADRHVVLWQSTTLAVRDAPLTDHDAAVRAVAFSPDGQRLISVGDDRQVLEHDLTRPTSLGRNHPGHRDRALAVAFTAAGDAFSVGADDRLIHHGQTLGSTLATRLPGVDLPAWALAWSPDGRQLASAGPDGAILLRDALSGAPVGQARRGHEALVTGLAFTPDGTLLASAGQDGRLFLWPVAGGPPRALQPAGEALQTVTVSPDGRTLAAAGRDGHILRWTLPDATPLPRLEHGAAVSDLAFAPDGRRLASAGRDGTLRLWNADGTAADRLDLPGDSLTRIAWPAGDGPLALATRTRGLLQWTPGDAAPRPLGNDEHALLALSFSPDGRQLASADVNGRVRLWDMVSRQAFHAPVQRFPGPVLALAFAPDGRRLAGTGWGGGVQLTPIGADLWSRMACERLRPLPPASPESACPAPENGRATTSRP
ncbi:MAG TPA: WD40 repeat domain-containing protein, partial [Rhodocyclaceae bacterium]|nr:WD40 repeat domain-containing protein [Rhodocyclaceae bacterium]